MAMKISKIEVWAAEIPDQPGGLARVLEALRRAGAKLECCIARRQPDRPGMGMVYVTPVRGKKAQDAARSAGLSPATDVSTVRVEGPDKPGIGAMLTRAVADAGVNMRGLSAAVIGNKFVCYCGFDSDSDAYRAAKAMKGADKPTKKRKR